jgi:polyhydroxyalkanoate synthesis regulator phasin
MLGTRKRVVVALGALVLASLFVVGTALADTPTPTAAAQKTNYRQVFVEKLAQALGVDVSTLQGKVKDAEKSTVDQAVANGDLAKNTGDKIKTEIDNSQSGILPGLGVLRGRAPALGLAARAKVLIAGVAEKAMAGKLGITVPALRQQLRSGKSLEALAKGKGLTVQDLYNAAADAVKARLDTMVKNGNLAQARADEIVQAVREGRLVGLNILPSSSSLGATTLPSSR